MRWGVLTALLTLSTIGLSRAHDARAAITRFVNVAPQPLGTALAELARTRNLQIIYHSEVVGARRTAGAVGEFTPEQELRQLLHGTGLTYRYLNHTTVTIVPVARAGAAAPAAPAASATKPAAAGLTGGMEGKSGSAAGFRLARAAQAKNPATPAEAMGQPILEEIVVTAQQRRQKLIDVPVAVSVISGEELEERGATNLQDLEYAIPGLSVVDFSPGQERIQLRGISSSTGLPTVGRYLNEMDINTDEVASGFDLRLYDMQRVEVLRGPQPTLYGDGSMGGTVRYITVKPDLTQVGGYVEGEGGDQTDGGGIYRTDGAFNLPLVPGQLALRVVGGFEHDGGWIDNSATGQPNQNSDSLKTARGTLLWQPTADFSVSLLGLHQDTDDADEDFGMRDRIANNLVPEPYTEHVNLGNLVISYDTDAVSVLSSTGYFQRKATTELDISGDYVPLLPLLGFPPGYVNAVGFGGPSVERVLTEELHLVSNGKGPLHYVLGTSFRRDREGNLGTTTTLPNPLPFQLLGTTSELDSTSESLYGELSYAFASGLEPLVGLRYFHDRQTVDGTTTELGMTPPASGTAADFHSLNPRLNLLYHTGASGIVYFNVAKGFRSGGFNTDALAPSGVNLPASYGPESLWSYELGTKQELIAHRMSVEAAVYYNRWDNLQTEVFAPGSELAVITNGGKAGGPGFDLTLIGRPVAGLTVTGTLGLNRMRYLATTLQHFDGDHIDYTAASTWSLSAEYRRGITQDVTGFVRADYQHSSPLYFTERNLAQIDVARGDEQGGLNLRLGGTFRDVEAYLFVNNAMDWNGVLLPNLADTPPSVLPRPREAGAGFRVTF